MILNFKTTIFSAKTLLVVFVFFFVSPTSLKGGINLRGISEAIKGVERIERDLDSSRYHNKVNKNKRPLTKKEKSFQRAKYKKYMAKRDADRKTFYGWVRIIVASIALLYGGLKLYDRWRMGRKTKK